MAPLSGRRDPMCGALHDDEDGVRCQLPAGHSEAHKHVNPRFVREWATDEQAERMRAWITEQERLCRMGLAGYD